MTLVLAAGSMLDIGADELVDVAAATGFDGVGVRVTGPHRPRQTEALGELAAAAGITVHDAEVHRIGDGPSDPTIELAAACGAERLLVVSDVADLDATARELERIVARAARAGVSIGLEYMAWTTPSHPTDALELARRTGCTIVVDVLHHVRVDAGPEELAMIVESGHLGWVQICDAAASPGAPDTLDALIQEARHGRLLPGDGALPLAALLAVVPPSVTLSVEVQSDALLAVPPLERAHRLYRATVAVVGADRPDHPNSTG